MPHRGLCFFLVDFINQNQLQIHCSIPESGYNEFEVINMKELNLSVILVKKRKEKGITQDQLASYIGVSKASVSKWETGQSYPDITFLPQLAAYFNVSVDELIGYEPQMTKEDIRRVYLRLAKDFSQKPAKEVFGECDGIIKKYYSCFPLLLQMIVLYMNHFVLLEKPEEQKTVIKTAADLCRRVKKESGDVLLSSQANSLEARMELVEGRPEKVLELLDEEVRANYFDETILSEAYRMLGNEHKARETVQISLYQHLLGLMSFIIQELTLYEKEEEKFEMLIRRGSQIAEAFDLDLLHVNAMAQLYFAAAVGYMGQKKEEKALVMIENYERVCLKNLLPYTLHGDDFFDLIDPWLNEVCLGVQAPREEKLIKQSVADGFKHPAFDPLKGNPRFEESLKRIQKEWRIGQ